MHACYVNPAFVPVYGFMSAQLQALEPFCLDRETTESGFSCDNPTTFQNTKNMIHKSDAGTLKSHLKHFIPLKVIPQTVLCVVSCIRVEGDALFSIAGSDKQQGCRGFMYTFL